MSVCPSTPRVFGIPTRSRDGTRTDDMNSAISGLCINMPSAARHQLLGQAEQVHVAVVVASGLRTHA